MKKFDYKKWKNKFLLKEQRTTTTYLGCSMCPEDNSFYGGMQVCTPPIPFTLNTDDIINNSDGFTDPFVLNFDEYIPGFESIGYFHDYMFQNEEIAETPNIGCIGGEGFNPYGCTDSNADNFNPQATIDDGSCIIPEPCPELQITFQPDAIYENPTTFNWTGGCPDLPIYATLSLVQGAMGTINVNYEAGGDYIPNTGEFTWNIPCDLVEVGVEYYYYMAQVIDENVEYGSANIYNMNGVDQGGNGFYLYSSNVLGTILITPEVCPTDGCTDPEACNYNEFANQDDGSCAYPEIECWDGTIVCSEADCSNEPIYGCTDPNADNYDEIADTDDGSCFYELLGCTDSEAENYNPEANTDDGSCTYPTPGCTDPNACNYDNTADTDDGSCEYDSCAGCMDDSTYFNIETQQEELIAVNYDPEATLPGPCQGCADQQSDNASFISVSQNFAVGSGNANQLYIDVLPEGWNTTEPWVSFDYGCLGCCVYSGCSDPEADNFWPMADPDNQPTTYGGTWTFIDDGSCEYTIEGCTDPQAGNYNPDATVDDGTCNYFVGPDPIEGCTDSEADNYNSEATQDDGSCEYIVFACETITSGTPAQIISEECTESISSEPANGETTFITLESCQDVTGCIKPEDEYGGCTDSEANNYDENASYDDGSCEYPGDPCEEYNTYDEAGQIQACYMAFEASVFDPSTGTGFAQEVIDFFNNLTNNGECCPEEPEPEIRYSCITPTLPEQIIDTNVQPTCVEDPNGPHETLAECELACPEIDCPTHLNSIEWTYTGFNNVNEFCGRCEVNVDAAESSVLSTTGQTVYCECCEGVIDDTEYATNMITGCDGFNSPDFPQSFRDLICEQCENPNYVNMHCDCCEEGVNYNIDAVTDDPDPGTPFSPIRPTPDPEISRMQKLAGLKNKNIK